MTEGKQSRRSLWRRPPPTWYGQGWPVKLFLSVALAAISVTFFLQWLQTGPTLRDLAQATATEKAQDACYDRFTAVITDRNAETLAAIDRQQSAQWALFVAVTRQPQNPEQVRKLVARGGEIGEQAADVADRYGESVDARTKWTQDGRHLPCPLAD